MYVTCLLEFWMLLKKVVALLNSINDKGRRVAVRDRAE